MNPRAEREEPRGKGLGRTEGTSVRHSGIGRGTLGTNAGELDRAKSAGHRASTANCRGRAPAMPKLAKHRARLRKLSTSKGVSPRGGAWGGLARSPAASGGEGRAREREKLCEMRRGASAGHRRGSKQGAGCVVHGAEREERGARGNNSATGELGPRGRERGSTRVKKPAPTGRLQWAASERERAHGERDAADRQGPPVRRRKRAGARPSWAELG
jgi:hypothetical protein